MGGSTVLTSYQRHQATGRREAHRFRNLVERLVGEELDSPAQRKLDLLAALEVEYRAYLKGKMVTRDSILRHLRERSSPFQAVLTDLRAARVS